MAIEMKLKYKIADGEFTIYTSRTLQVLAVMFGIIYVVTIGAILCMSYSLNGEIKSEYLLLFLLLFLIFPVIFLAGNKRIIFKQKDQTVYKSFGFGQKEAVRFSEIASVKYVGGANCYKIFLKSDPYGKGITITAPVTGKERERFETENLPVLQQMISVEETLPPPSSVELDKLKYYTRKGNIVETKRLRTVIWAFVLALIGLAVLILVSIVGNKSDYLFPIPLLLAAIYQGTSRRFFDVSNHTFNTSAMFFFRKNYRIEQFVNFRTVRHTTNGMYDDTSIELIFVDEKGKENSVKLLKIRKTKKIESIIAETKAIMEI
jgi:hypothetical protein